MYIKNRRPDSLKDNKELNEIKLKNKNQVKEIQRLKKEDLIKEEIIIPIYDKLKIEEEYERSNSYRELKNNLIEKKWNNKNSSLKKIGDYLYKKLYDFEYISIREVSEELRINIQSVKQSITTLNFYSKYPLTIIPVKNKKGYIQAISRNETDAIDWERRKFRTIETMSQTKEKGELLMSKFFKRKNSIKNKKVIMVTK
jgi:hypothetical protein